MDLVSIIVRTCNRPVVLRENLKSIRKQTYSNIEVIVVEDGMNASQEMIEKEFSDLNIVYSYTGKKKGRSFVGNKALQLASGKYINFLDDDDIFFEDHIDVLVNALKKGNAKAAYAIAYESTSQYDIKKGCFIERGKRIRYSQPFNRIYLYYNNYIPIQTIMFERSLYDDLGGFDENLELLEDWDLWVRYTTKTDFLFVDKITSLYRIPIKHKMRDKELRRAYEKISKKFDMYDVKLSIGTINSDMKFILEEIKTPKWKKIIKSIISI